ncbi:hypothetical protein [Kitasatospora sp. NPDC059462]|uniref:hypothetical protein n=1 Tax=Kitasatospora sp. NPDC059462 TaxID=3346841 RepID=UPI003681D1DD
MSETPDEKTLVEAVDALADRFRAMPQSRLLGAVPGHPSRAAAGLALARRLAAAALAAEGARPAGGAGGGAGGGPSQELPDAGAFAVGDQLAVVGHDLAAALAALPADAAVALPDGPLTVRALRAQALGWLAETTAAL